MGIRLLIALIIAGLAACKQGQEIAYFDLNEKITQRILEYTHSDSRALLDFEFCDLLPEGDWDSALVIHPNTGLEKIEDMELTNWRQIKSDLKSIASMDDRAGILFVKGHTVQFFSLVNRRLDFSSMTAFRKEACGSLKITADSHEGAPSYKITLE